jgi:hypothetical protein
MKVRFVFAVLAVALTGGVGCPGKDDAPAKTQPAAERPGPIERAKAGVEKANEAGLRRTDDAVDRATKAEAVDRGAPARR